MKKDKIKYMEKKSYAMWRKSMFRIIILFIGMILLTGISIVLSLLFGYEINFLMYFFTFLILFTLLIFLLYGRTQCFIIFENSFTPSTRPFKYFIMNKIYKIRYINIISVEVSPKENSIGLKFIKIQLTTNDSITVKLSSKELSILMQTLAQKGVVNSPIQNISKT
ncbi:MAG: hypothetical protein FP824_07725 [Euryarchaeota archaeon]|nr:hypothetical protein [Euryarchaeota archaeon]MBU4032270.1 hypothetical protein [Candidatus Thermoplasmatota archaeon]